MDDTTRQVIEQIAQRFGTTAEHLWTVGVQYQHASGYVGCIAGAALLLAAFATAWALFAIWRMDKDFDEKAMISIMPSIALAGLLVGGIAAESDGILSLACPEGAFLHDIIAKIHH